MQVKNMALCGMFSALLAVCAWLAFPLGDVAITLQTFGVFLCLGVLGGKRGTIAIFVYLLLGAIGLPVFSGFRGGIGALMGVTGGYLTGFLFSGLVYWLLTHLFPKHILPAMIAGLLVCYSFGSIWYYIMYIGTGNAATLGWILVKCVLPYLLPDTVKLLLAWQLQKKLKPFV
ncbi:MAG: biotin transporter BioY [Oscillospiraceae bacterium]|nr:biotin transporter BioY [Oscillospiraceae bacterium]